MWSWMMRLDVGSLEDSPSVLIGSCSVKILALQTISTEKANSHVFRSR